MPKTKATVEQEWRKKVKAFIDYRRNMVGKTNAALAKEMKMNPSTLSAKKRYPERFSFGEAKTLARILGCKPEEIMCGGSTN